MRKKISRLLGLVFLLSLICLSPVRAREEEVTISSKKKYEEVRKELEKEINRYYKKKDKYDLSTDGIDLIDLTYRNYKRDVKPLIEMDEFSISELEDYARQTYSTFDFIEEEHKLRRPLILDINKYYADVSNMKTYQSHALDTNTQKDNEEVLDTFTSLTNFNTTYKYIDSRDIWDIKNMFMMMEKNILMDLENYYEEEYGNPVKLYQAKGSSYYNYLDKKEGKLENNSLLEGILDKDKIRFLKDGQSFYARAKDLEEVTKLYKSRGAKVHDKNQKEIGFLEANRSLRGSLLKDGKIEFDYQGKKAYVDLDQMEDDSMIYISKGSNLRDIYGNRLATLEADDRIEAIDRGTFVETQYLGHRAYSPKKYMRPYYKLYISKGLDLKGLDGKKLAEVPAGRVLAGEIRADKFYFTYQDRDYIGRADQVKRSEEVYISKGLNLRDSQGKKKDYIKKGTRIKGIDLGQEVELVSRSKTYKVSRDYLYLDYQVYKSQGVRVRDEKFNKLGYLDKGKLVRGIDRGDFLEIDYDRQRGFVDKKYLIKQK